MTFAIKFTPGARKDLRAIHEYILQADSEDKAESVVRGIIRAALSLQQLPERGAFPDELLRSGNKRYRQIFFKPYRILYRVRANVVHIAVIADGRRDMATLLARRLDRS
jgi:toxin ParE1/3/4